MGSISSLGGLLGVVFLTFVFRGTGWLSRMGGRLSRRYCGGCGRGSAGLHTA